MIRAWLTAVLLSCGALNAVAADPEWNVWDAVRAPSTLLVEPQRLEPELPLVGRKWLPDTSDAQGRIYYLAQMYNKAERCIAAENIQFSQADLDLILQLVGVVEKNLSQEDAWRLRSGLLHPSSDGVLVHSSCWAAKKWLLEDFPEFEATSQNAKTSPTP